TTPYVAVSQTGLYGFYCLKSGKRGKGWISPAFAGHLTFLKMSRIRGTHTAKPMIEAKAESE
ncbi:hypothetical protein ACFFOA_004866, partial [Enterobacter cloacae]